MWALEVVVIHPRCQFADASIRVGVDERISPFAKQSLNETFGLAVGTRRVRSSANVPDGRLRGGHEQHSNRLRQRRGDL